MQAILIFLRFIFCVSLFRNAEPSGNGHGLFEILAQRVLSVGVSNPAIFGRGRQA